MGNDLRAIAHLSEHLLYIRQSKLVGMVLLQRIQSARGDRVGKL
jgi:hypothetical protein